MNEYPDIYSTAECILLLLLIPVFYYVLKFEHAVNLKMTGEAEEIYISRTLAHNKAFSERLIERCIEDW